MNIFVVVHDQEPSDSGSDFRRASTLPSRFDTEIIGLYSSYRKAKRAAKKYLASELDVDEGDIEDDIDWLGDGWCPSEDYGGEGSVIGPSTVRIHIEQFELDSH